MRIVHAEDPWLPIFPSHAVKHTKVCELPLSIKHLETMLYMHHGAQTNKSLALPDTGTRAMQREVLYTAQPTITGSFLFY